MILKTARAALSLGCGALWLVAGCVAVPKEPEGPEAVIRSRARVAPPARSGTSSASGLSEQVLPSGLRVLWDAAPPGSLAGVVAVVRGGSRLDPPGSEGLAHLVEHLTYRAVDRAAQDAPDATRWNRLIRLAVGEMNGFTTPDCLIFYELAPPVQESKLIAFEVARLADPLAGIDEHAFALEQEIIGSETLLRADPRAEQGPVTQMLPRLFPTGHPYARPTGGTDESRARLTLPQARAYAARVFRPENMTLLVTSPPGGGSLESVIQALPPGLRDGPRPAPAAGTPPVSPPPTASAPADSGSPPPIPLARLVAPLPATELWLGWTLPGSYGPQGPAQDLLAAWLQQDLQSDQLAKEDSGILEVRARLVPGAETGVLLVRTLIDAKADPERVARVVSARVTSLWSREPAARPVLARLRSSIHAERVLDEPGQLARVLGEATDAALGGRARSEADMLRAVESVTNSSVAQLAYQTLTADRAHATLFTPEPPGRGAVKRSASAAEAAGARERPTAPLIAGAEAWNGAELGPLLPRAARIQTVKTTTGLTVVTLPRPGRAAVAWLAFRGGYADGTPPLLVELALRARPDATQAPTLDILPGRGATRDLSFDLVEFRPERLDEALTLLFAKATAAVNSWPSREELTRLLAPVAAAEVAQQQQAQAAFARALFGDHRDAHLVTAGDLDKVTRSDVDAWIGRVHNLRNGALVVVGDIDPVRVARAAEVLSKANPSPAWVAEIPTPRAPPLRSAGGERTVSVVTARHSALVDVRLGCLLPALTVANGVADELLARAIESRLNDAIRIEQGDGYGVNVGLERLRDGATYLTAETSVPERSLLRTLAEMRRHWQRWGHAGFDASEVNVARWRAAATLASGWAQPNSVAMMILNRWSAEPAALATAPLVPDLGGVTPARLNELFATCRANAVLGLTGDEAHIRSALEQAWPQAR